LKKINGLVGRIKKGQVINLIIQEKRTILIIDFPTKQNIELPYDNVEMSIILERWKVRYG